MSTGTVNLHCVLKAQPEKIYRAFLNTAALTKWLPPYGYTCTVHHLDARVGGTFKMAFENFSSGASQSFGGEYLELVPGQLIRYTDVFDDPQLPGELQVKVSLRTVSCGTELRIEQSGIPVAIPVEMCYLGWRDSLAQLTQLVEAELPA